MARTPADEGIAAARAEGKARERARRVKVLELAYHRNGMCGAPFYVITFTHKLSGDDRPMVGIVFREEGSCAVFNREKLGAGVIAFGDGDKDPGCNAFRGDMFEADLRAVILLDRGLEAF